MINPGDFKKSRMGAPDMGAFHGKRSGQLLMLLLSLLSLLAASAADDADALLLLMMHAASHGRFTGDSRETCRSLNGHGGGHGSLHGLLPRQFKFESKLGLALVTFDLNLVTSSGEERARGRAPPDSQAASWLPRPFRADLAFSSSTSIWSDRLDGGEGGKRKSTPGQPGGELVTSLIQG